VVLEDEPPRDMDHRSSNPDKPLAGTVGMAPEAGALFDAATIGVRVTGVDVDVAGDSGCDDVQSVFCAGIGDIVAAKDWDGLWLATAASGFNGVLKLGGEVDLWACDPSVGLTVYAGGRAELFSISIRVGRVAGGEAGDGADGAA